MSKYELPEGQESYVITHEGAEPMIAFTPHEVAGIRTQLATTQAKLAEVEARAKELDQHIGAEFERYCRLIEWDSQSPDSDDVFSAVKHNVEMVATLLEALEAAEKVFCINCQSQAIKNCLCGALINIRAAIQQVKG